MKLWKMYNILYKVTYTVSSLKTGIIFYSLFIISKPSGLSETEEMVDHLFAFN